MTLVNQALRQSSEINQETRAKPVKTSVSVLLRWFSVSAFLS